MYQYGILDIPASVKDENKDKQEHKATALWIERLQEFRDQNCQGNWFVYGSEDESGTNFNRVADPKQDGRYLYLSHYNDGGSKKFSASVIEGKDITADSVPVDTKMLKTGELKTPNAFQAFVNDPWNEENKEAFWQFCRNLLGREERRDG